MVPDASTRPFSWLAPFILPLLLLALLLVEPTLDLRLPSSSSSPFQNPVHFWLIATAGAIALLMGIQMSVAAERRTDARLFLVALSVLSVAGFLILHALATPNILVQGRNAGFIIAAPVGLVLASLFAAASTVELSPERAKRLIAFRTLLRSGVLGFIAVFIVLALLKLPPLTWVPEEEAITTPILFCLVGIAPLPGFQFPVTAIIVAAVAAFGWTSWRYLQLYRRRPTTVLLGLGTAYGVLALTTLNLGLSRTWKISWWEWHALVTVAFWLLAYSAQQQFRREGNARQIYDSVYLEETIKQIRQEYSSALESLVTAMRRRAEAGDAGDVEAEAVAVGQRFDLSDGQVRVLEQAAAALAGEREQIARLGALVAVGQETSIILDETQLLRRAVALTSAAFGRDELRIGLVQGGKLDFPMELRSPMTMDSETNGIHIDLYNTALNTLQPAEHAGVLVLPLTVKGHAAGVLEACRGRGSFAERDRYLLRSLASQLSVALENARLYRQIDVLFRQYMPASVATTLLADPTQAALGGAVQEVSVMFGDIRGFTTLSERMRPPEVVRLLNRFFGAATKEVLVQGGTIDKFMGDAMMALFNAPTRQPDHALRACRAALAMQRALTPLTAEADNVARFGIGINTGEALVGNIGSEEIRNFTAIGDAINLASRLQTRAEGGQVLISANTYALVRDHVDVQPLGMLYVKGREEPVEAFLLLNVREA